MIVEASGKSLKRIVYIKIRLKNVSRKTTDDLDQNNERNAHLW